MIKWTRSLVEQLHRCAGAVAVDEAFDHAGLPPVFVWDRLSVDELHRLRVAVRVRLMESHG